MRLSLEDTFKLEGSYHDKIMSPEITIENFKKNAASAGIDILKNTRRIDNNRLGIPVYFSLCGHDARRITGTRKQMGKGVSPALAEASAVMELAERFSIYSFMNSSKNFIHGTYDTVKQNALPFSLIAQSVNEPEDSDMALLETIFSTLPFKWTTGYNVSRNQEMLVPMDWFFMINAFNGSSAGNCNEEAICQGACEIVERHVSALIDGKRQAPPFIDPLSITHPVTKALVDKFTQAGIKLFINDFTLDMGIPSIGVLAYDPYTFPHTSEIVWTAGTGTSPDAALNRALTETAQLGGDFNTGSNYMASGLSKFKTLEEAGFIINAEKNNTTFSRLGSMPDISTPNIKEEISAITRALTKKSMEMLTIQTTHPDLSMPAFYTMIPGTAFRERAENSSVAMFAAKHICETLPPPRALEELEKIDQILPDRYYIKFYLGMCRLNMEEPEKALTCLETAMDLDPSDQDMASICSYAGVCLKETGAYEKALEVLEKGIAADRDREDIYNLMGFCCFMLKKHKESIACFEKVLTLNPGSAIDHASIASNYRELGNSEKAVQYYETALDLDPGLDFARENLEKLKTKS
ncbi:MAG: YcaO-like family protein [Desulfobacteraceae bacterium]